MYRGCAVSTDRNWRDCVNQLTMGCSFCQANNCNGQVLVRNGTQQCVVCQGEECRTKTKLTVCTHDVYHSNPEYCYYRMDETTVVEKGCGHTNPYSSPPPKHLVDSACQGNGCNLELPLTYSSCSNYHGGYQGLSRRNQTQCHQKESQYWRPGCFYRLTGNSNLLIFYRSK